MADYKEMYLTLMRGTERAIAILVDAQRKCEDLYISTADREPAVLVPSGQAAQGESAAAPESSPQESM